MQPPRDHTSRFCRLGGSDPIVAEPDKWGYFFMAIEPELLLPIGEFKERIEALRSGVESSRPAQGFFKVRVPGSASHARLEEGRSGGWIEVEDEIYRRITGPTA